MKELLEYIAKNLVDNKNSVVVEKIEESNLIILKLKVSKEDVGKVIGKQGHIAKSIRNVIKACSIYNNKKVLVEINKKSA